MQRVSLLPDLHIGPNILEVGLQDRVAALDLILGLLNVGAAGVQRLAAAPRTPKDECAGEEREEPEQHVGQVDPHGPLHPDLTALLGCRVSRDVDTAKETEKRCPEDAVTTIFD